MLQNSDVRMSKMFFDTGSSFVDGTAKTRRPRVAPDYPIALQTGRAKDKARLLQFVEEGALDAVRFQEIVRRHNLIDAWAKFERQFLSETP